jgi:molybdate/tungstate transport system substrate-binding protein
MRSGLLVACLVLSGCSQRNEVIVFHATSLSRVFADAAERLQARVPALTLRLEPSGSQVAARKVSEQGLRADVVAVADDAILERLLVPRLAPRVVVFATNELVLAHLTHSTGTDEMSAVNWPDLLSRPGVRLGRVDADLAPVGYHTLIAWQLAEQTLARPGLAHRLRQGVAKEHVAHDEAELLALLEARAVDYAFLYRSTAEDHRLKVTPLPDEVNLSRPELGEGYGQATIEVQLRSGDARTRLRGRVITYGLVVPTEAQNPRGAEAFLDLLFSEDGRRMLERHGFRPLAERPK